MREGFPMAPNLYRIRAESGEGDVDPREAGLFDAVDTVPAASSPAYSRSILTKLAEVRVTLWQSWVSGSSI